MDVETYFLGEFGHDTSVNIPALLKSAMTAVSQDFDFIYHPRNRTFYSTVSKSLLWGTRFFLFGPEERVPPPIPIH